MTQQSFFPNQNKTAQATKKKAKKPGPTASQPDPTWMAKILVDGPFIEPLNYAIPHTMMEDGSVRASENDVHSKQKPTLRIGDIVTVPLRSRPIIGVITDILPVPSNIPFKLKNIENIFYHHIPEKLFKWARYVAQYNLWKNGQITRFLCPKPLMEQAVPCSHSYALSKEIAHNPHAQEKLKTDLSRSGKKLVLLNALLAQHQHDKKQGHHTCSTIKTLASDVVIRESVKQGWLIKKEIPDYKQQLSEIVEHLESIQQDKQSPIHLSEEQARIYDDFKKTQTQHPHYKAFLLHGETGSGKSYVFFQMVLDALLKKQKVLLLVPEIGLVHHMANYAKKILGIDPFLWHSSLSMGQKKSCYQAVQEKNTPCLVIGTRSALWLPIYDLGLMILDEEHDQSYKQQEKPIYNARDMAILRASIEDCPIILSSATPSLESFANAFIQKKYHYWRLGNRFGSATLPTLELCDLKEHTPDKHQFLSPYTIEMIRSHLDHGGQIFLFLNRRGYAPVTLCKACGHKMSCNACSSYLVYHKKRDILTCHHCDYKRFAPFTCDECQSEDLMFYGPGVEKIHEEIQQHFSDTPSTTITRDDISKPQDMAEKLDRIKNGDISIITGTQILSKGFHFPNLTLAVVVDADWSLEHIDPKSDERLFQLLHQVAGRAGRGDKKGTILVQTYNPNAKLWSDITKPASDFYTHEWSKRQKYNLPPTTPSIMITSQSKNEKAALLCLKQLSDSIQKHTDFPIHIRGPIPATMAKRQHFYHAQLLLLGHSNGTQKNNSKTYLQTVLKQAIEHYKKQNTNPSADLYIDIDPLYLT